MTFFQLPEGRLKTVKKAATGTCKPKWQQIKLLPPFPGPKHGSMPFRQ